MTETRVIHYRDWDRSDENAVYIGRSMRRFNLDGSPWANPFRIGTDGDREQVIDKYRHDLFRRLREDDSLSDDLAELHGRTLVCWCAPRGGVTMHDLPHVCHGQVLAEVADLTVEARKQREQYYGDMADAASY